MEMMLVTPSMRLVLMVWQTLLLDIWKR